jgi:hypothetical protein
VGRADAASTWLRLRLPYTLSGRATLDGPAFRFSVGDRRLVVAIRCVEADPSLSCFGADAEA